MLCGLHLVFQYRQNTKSEPSAAGPILTMVRVARFERAASSSQSWRPTNWATPGNMKFWRLCCYYTMLAVVVKHVVISQFFREMQGGGDPRDPSKIRASQVSHRRRRIACVHAPKAGALPTGLHPDTRQKILASFRCRSPAAGERLPPNDGGSPPFPLRS